MLIILNYCVYIIFSGLFTCVFTDVLDSEQSTFFGFTREVPISSSTLELVQQLEEQVYKYSRGDRRVRRYFDNYDTPFVGHGRRANNEDYY